MVSFFKTIETLILNAKPCNKNKTAFRARKLTGTFEKQASERYLLTTGPVCTNKDKTLKREAFSPS